MGLLSDDANFDELDKIRDWLPNKNPRLKRLQINFFYLSELTKDQPVRSRLARLASPEQAVYDFPFWRYVCGEQIDESTFLEVSAEQFLCDQVKVVREREQWTRSPTTVNDLQYYCKSLVWLCWAIQKLHNSKSVFSWDMLQQEATEETKSLVNELTLLKQSNWDQDLIRKHLDSLLSRSSKLLQSISWVDRS